MSTSPTAVPKVRTFATDLQAVRARTGGAPAVLPVVTPAVESPITTTKTENGIPPFHTFSHPEKEPTSAPVATEAVALVKNATHGDTQKILSASGALSAQGTVKESLPAVIITDTKHKRFKLSEAITASVTDWWSHKQKTAQLKKVPKYTVPEAEMRKGVIQKATSKTGRTSSADHSAVVSRIKATKQVPRIENVPVEPAAVLETTPSWESGNTTISTLEQTPIINPRIVKRVSNVVQLPPTQSQSDTTTIHNWETPVQAQVNALSSAPLKTDSPIIITGKEFSRIKQERATRSVVTEPTAQPIVVPSLSLPKIKPIIPALSNITSAPEPKVFASTVDALPSIVRPIIPQEPEIQAPEVFVPTPAARPKIVPIIPSNPIISQEIASTTSTTVAVTPIVAVLDTPAPTVVKVPERRFAPPRETKRGLFAVLSQTNHIVFITCGILVMVVVSGLGLRSYLASATPTPEAPISTPDTSFSGTVVYNAENRVENKTQISEAIVAKSAGQDSLVEVVFSDSNGNILTGATLLSLFGASVPFDFKASLSSVRLGGYRGEPWILFTISDRNTALGGMLSWEGSLARDLASLFTTDSLGSRNQYTDSIINSIDVRVLKDDTGVEKIIYGFTGYNQLLITTNTTAFLNLTEKINQ